MQLSSNDDTSDDEDAISSDDSNDVIAPQPSTSGTSVRGRGVGGGRGILGARGRGVYRGRGRGIGRGVRGGRGAGGRRGRAVPPVVLPPGWKKTTDAVPPTVNQFTVISGPTEMLPSTSTPLDFFNQLFGASLFPDIVMATNLNAVAKSPPAAIVADDRYATSDRNWHVTNVEEMRAFFAINMAMGISENPEYKDFWCADPVLRNMFVASTMPRLRYEKLCQYLHCSVVEDEDAGDRLAKVRPLITLCDRQFKACYTPNQNVSVDEAMIRFDGRLGWKQYMPKKPVKWGMKIWCLCDSETGYCSAFSVYTGATGNPNDGLDLGYRVVMNLMRPFLSSNRHVFADNYFTSVHLAKDLLQEDTYLCGTTRRTRREFPNTLAAIPLRSGESAKWTTDDNLVMLCKWHDKRDVYMIATNDSGEDIIKQTRRGNQLVDLSVPECVARYNKSMGGVDHLDQMRSYYGIGRSGLRWWKYLFWGILNIGVINAFTLWRLCNRPLPANSRQFSLKTFKVRLIHQLADPWMNARQAVAPPPLERVRSTYTLRDTLAGHPLVRIEGRKRACDMCRRHKRRRVSGRAIESCFGCSTCNVHLCKDGCFDAFHA